MSRTRPKPKPRNPNPAHVIDIVCTGRRTHSRNRLGTVHVYVRERRVFHKRGPEPYVYAADQHGGVPEEHAPEDFAHTTRSYRCGRCPADVPLTDSKADEILIGLAERGEPRLDISALHVL